MMRAPPCFWSMRGSHPLGRADYTCSLASASSEDTFDPPAAEKPRGIDPIVDGAERHIPARHPGRHTLPMVRPVPKAMRSEDDSNPGGPRHRCGERRAGEGKRDHEFGGDDPEPPIDEGKAEIDTGNERECQGREQNRCWGR